MSGLKSTQFGKLRLVWNSNEQNNRFVGFLGGLADDLNHILKTYYNGLDKPEYREKAQTLKELVKIFRNVSANVQEGIPLELSGQALEFVDFSFKGRNRAPFNCRIVFPKSETTQTNNHIGNLKFLIDQSRIGTNRVLPKDQRAGSDRITFCLTVLQKSLETAEKKKVEPYSSNRL